MVIIPKKAITHIQKTAPGPPVMMAPDTPTILPVPTVAARAVQRDWNCEIDLSFVWLVISLSLKMAPMVLTHQCFRCVTWKKPAKKGRVYTVKWKKDKTADGYLLEYSFLKSTDLKIESKTYKKTISAKKTSFKLKKMPKKYDIVWIKMKPYIKSGDKKICYDYAQNYEIRKTKIYRR